MRKFFFLLAVMALALAGCSEDEAVMTGTISGLVSDYASANAPIGGATVTLSGKGLAKTTGSDGRFEFTGVEPGTYTLSVQASGYQPTTKQVTIYAGDAATCDFQLQKGSAQVDVSPQNLVYGPDVETLSFIIKNQSVNPQQFTVSGVPSFATVSKSAGSVAAKGSEAVGVTILNRKSIQTAQSGQLTVNVGDNAFVVNLNVEAYREEAVSVNVSPQSLTFSANTDQLSFALTSNTGRALAYTVSSNLDILTVTPVSGTLSARGTSSISVTVNDRQNVTADRSGTLTIAIEGNTYTVAVSVKKYESGGSQGGGEEPNPEPGDNVTRGLMAYYNFDGGNADDAQGNYHGFANGGTYVTDTPNGSGKALYLKQKQYISIGSAPFSGKTKYSVSMWIRDFGTGCLLKTKKGSYYTNPTIAVTDNLQLRYTTGYSQYSGSNKTFSPDLSNFQIGQWVMLTIVTEVASAYDVTSTLYINGRRVDAVSSDAAEASGGTAMEIGGTYGNGWTDAMKIDNVRFYNVALTDDEVAAIYNYEK